MRICAVDLIANEESKDIFTKVKYIANALVTVEARRKIHIPHNAINAILKITAP